jgi:hypothetical protein
MTSFVPRVAPGMGAELNDKFATRLVDRWLGRIAEIEENTHAKMRRAIESGSGMGGTPKSQSKVAGRIREGMRDVLLHSALVTGTRARFKFAIDALWVGPCVDGSAQWLQGNRVIMTKEGVAHRTQYSEFTVAAFTRHAIVRAVQRLNTETTDDLLATVRAAWPSVLLAELVTRDERTLRRGGAWLIPFRAPTQHPDDFAVAVMAGAGESDAHDLFFVKTIITSDQLRMDDQFDPALKLLDAIGQFDMKALMDVVKTDEALAKLAPLFEACRSKGA